MLCWRKKNRCKRNVASPLIIHPLNEKPNRFSSGYRRVPRFEHSNSFAQERREGDESTRPIRGEVTMIRRHGRLGGRMDRDWMFERLNVIPFEKVRLKIRGVKGWIFGNFDGACNGRLCFD